MGKIEAAPQRRADRDRGGQRPFGKSNGNANANAPRGAEGGGPGGSGEEQGMIDLEKFLPYRLAVLANTFSRVLAPLYEDKYGLTVAEWRLLAILARFGPLSANGVCARAEMDKVRVSRAVARAMANGLVDRKIDRADRRRSILTLTPRGRAIHDEIVPRALEREAEILGALDEEEAETLFQIIGRLQGQANSVKARVASGG
jgi:DNA-binding MarR family transcriptional regulator